MTCPWPDCEGQLEGLGTYCHRCGRYAADAAGIPSPGQLTVRDAEEEPGLDGAQVFTLPMPPSMNAMWRAVARLKGMGPVKEALGEKSWEKLSAALDQLEAFATNILSTEGRDFKKKAEEWLKAQKVQMIRGHVSVRATFYLGRRGSDVDNRVKPLLDALEGHVYENDKQVHHLAVWKRIDHDNPRCLVAVEPGDGPPEPFSSVEQFTFDLEF